MKDQLFLLKPGFFDGDRGPSYCNDCVSVEGLLSYFPTLRDDVAVHYIDFPRPRSDVVALLGEEHQSMPVLVLADDAPADGIQGVQSVGGRRFIDSEADIRSYLSTRYGVALAR